MTARDRRPLPTSHSLFSIISCREENICADEDIKDVTFFKRDKQGQLLQIARNTSSEKIIAADSCTLKLSNQRNGWRGIYINHHANGDPIMCPVRVIGRWYVHITANKYKPEMLLSSYWIGDKKYDVMDDNFRSALKVAAVALNYPEMKGILINQIDTHSFRGGVMNALSLSGYSDREIHKMGQLKSNTFKEYISDQLSDFSEEMSRSMKKVFNFVNIKEGVHHDITITMVNVPYAVPASAA